MQVRTARSSAAKVEQQMTPMIDVVFQLLVFFVMSFKVATLEGDFHIQMSPQLGSGSLEGLLVSPLKLRLAADANGELASVAMNQQQFAPGDWQSVQRDLLRIAGS